MAASSASKPRRNHGSLRPRPDEAELRIQPAFDHADIGPADDVVAPQQRHGVIAEPALLGFRVGLEPVFPAPQVLEPPTFPHDRVERRQQPHGFAVSRDAPRRRARSSARHRPRRFPVHPTRAGLPPFAAIRPAQARRGSAGRTCRQSRLAEWRENADASNTSRRRVPPGGSGSCAPPRPRTYECHHAACDPQQPMIVQALQAPALSPWRSRPSRSPRARGRSAAPDPPDASAPGRARRPTPRRPDRLAPASARRLPDRVDAAAGGVTRHEAIGVEEILLQPEPREPPFEVACAIAGHAMPQDQILRARRRADRIRLHEAAVPIARASVTGGGSDPSTACRRSAAMVSLPAIPFSAPAIPRARARAGGTGARRAARPLPGAPSGWDAPGWHRSAPRRSSPCRPDPARRTACRADAAAARGVMPMRRSRSTSSIRLGGVFRYSTTRGSTPASRIMPSTLRDVVQAGLW